LVALSSDFLVGYTYIFILFGHLYSSIQITCPYNFYYFLLTLLLKMIAFWDIAPCSLMRLKSHILLLFPNHPFFLFHHSELNIF
jgi:hypothetical protein